MITSSFHSYVRSSHNIHINFICGPPNLSGGWTNPETKIKLLLLNYNWFIRKLRSYVVHSEINILIKLKWRRSRVLGVCIPVAIEHVSYTNFVFVYDLLLYHVFLCVFSSFQCMHDWFRLVNTVHKRTRGGTGEVAERYHLWCTPTFWNLKTCLCS